MTSAWSGSKPTPMFPLGSVLFPHHRMSLRVFEPRYREMVRDCLAGDGHFGVVLIERGSEVGGGDSRFATGTMASIGQYVEMPNGNWLLEATGSHRIRVIRWLADDPYPRAMVEDAWESEPTDRAPALRDDVSSRLRRVLALRTELGDVVMPATSELSDDVSLVPWQAAVLAEFTALDNQRLMEQPGTDERLQLLVEMLDEQLTTLEARLAGPSS